MEAPQYKSEDEFVKDVMREVAKRMATEVEVLYMEGAFHEPPIKIVPKE